MGSSDAGSSAYLVQGVVRRVSKLLHGGLAKLNAPHSDFCSQIAELLRDLTDMVTIGKVVSHGQMRCATIHLWRHGYTGIIIWL